MSRTSKESGYTRDLFDYVFTDPESSSSKFSDSIFGKKAGPQTVSQLTRKIRMLVEGTFDNIYIEGEISNFRPNASGHYYFTLKDATSQIPAVMFKNTNWKVKFKIENGMKVIVAGKVQIYEPHGKYQVICNSIEPSGIGSLQIAFEQLKKKLSSEGLFEAERKRPLPVFPKTIGVLTSATGAAIHDIINVLTRRFPGCHLVLCPVPVQGDLAAAKIASAIKACNQINLDPENQLNFDVLIVGRGGGSVEDLWAFNEESVARAIADSEIPIISAVGHETDLSISDMVADKSAPTPSAAAEIVIQSRDYWQNQIKHKLERMDNVIDSKMRTYRQSIEKAKTHYAFKEPTRIIEIFRLRLDDYQNRISNVIEVMGSQISRRLTLAKKTLISSETLLTDRISKASENLKLRSRIMEQLLNNYIEKRQIKIVSNLDKLELLGPHAVVRRGYSITRLRGQNKPLHGVNDVKVGDCIETDVRDGTIHSEITNILK